MVLGSNLSMPVFLCLEKTLGEVSFCLAVATKQSVYSKLYQEFQAEC